jgi:hypothetical protein
MMFRVVLSAVTAAVALASSGAIGQQRDAMKVCEADVKKYCANVQLGEGRIAKCLRENQGQVSPDCKAKLKEIGARAKERGGQKGTSTEQTR